LTVQATAANGCTGTGSFTITVTPPPVVLTAAPAMLDFGIVPAGTSATQAVTLTNVSATPIVLTTLTVSGADAARFSAGAPAATTLGAGASTTASITFAPTSGGVRSATLTAATTGGSSASVALAGTGSVATPVVISEFRTRGPNQGNDEFVEIYNNTDAPIDIGGWQLRGSSNTAPTNPTPRASVPAGVLLPARAHFLFVNTGAYSGAVPGNVGYTTGIADNGGIALTTAAGTIVDQVGVTTTGTAYREGNPLAVQLTTNVDRSYARKPAPAAGSLQDTDDNATDFVLVTPGDPQDLVFNATPARVEFGGAPTGDTRSAAVTIRNLLLVPVTLTSAAVGGADASTFDAGPLASATIAGGGTAALPVQFHPAAVGTFTAQATVDSDRGAVTIDLAGVGTPGIIVTPASIDFGSVEPGVASSALVSIANGEAANVTLSPPFSITGADAAAFSAGAPGAALLAAGGGTTASVTFQATPLGPKSALLTVTSVDGGTRTVSLSGSIACPAIAVSATLPPAEALAAYSQTVTASGGTGPYTFSVIGGALPAGLSLSAAGALTGTPAAVGQTSATIQAQAASGCAGSAAFTLSVVDTRPPTLTLPADIAATATTPAGAAVGFTASAVDLVDGARPVSCAPASGSIFAIGTTAVACSAADASGNAATGSFNVVVTAADLPGRMVGDASIARGAVAHDIAFAVQERTGGADAGALRYEIRTKVRGRDTVDRFESTLVTSVSFFDVPGVSPGKRPPSGVDTVLLAGRGVWNGRSGYSFEAVARDAGEPGPGADAFAVTVRDGAGAVVASIDGTITAGNIQSLRVAR
jgi:hypothetical protein